MSDFVTCRKNIIKYYKDTARTLVARSRSLCDSYNIDMMKYVLSDDYKTITKQTVSPVISPGTNGLVDSVRALLSDYTADKSFIKILLTFLSDLGHCVAFILFIQ